MWPQCIQKEYLDLYGLLQQGENTQNEKAKKVQDDMTKKVLRLMNEMRFMKEEDLQDLKSEDKFDLAKQFTIKKFPANSRFYDSFDKLDAFYIIIEGHVGIFNPEHHKMA